MSNLLVASTISVWFVLCFPIAMRSFQVARTPEGAPWAAPFLLNVAFSFSLVIFNVQREDGAAVLQEGLSASNIMTITISLTAGVYLAYRILTRRSVVLLPFADGYRPYTSMILLDLLSTCWSVVPQYTLYRSFELMVYYTLTLLVFDRSDIRAKFSLIVSSYILVWLVLALPEIATNLASGIVFSSAKNNTIPLACAALMLLALFQPALARRKATFAFGFVSFVIAGSASSAGALLWAIPPACLIASERPGLRALGLILGLLTLLVFAFLVVGMSAFPELVGVLSVILQKPPVELEHATGRADFWPIFIIATRDHMFGSGFSAADRFIQFLVPFGEFPDTYVRDQVHFGNSHNMFLSAWAATGVAGLALAVSVLGSAARKALRLDVGSRRFVLSLVFMLILNGLTTPGIFQDWGPMNFAFVAVVAYTRIGRLGAVATPVPLERGRAWAPRFRPAADGLLSLRR